MGAGKMGSFFIDLLSFDHEVAVFERDPKRMRFTYNCQRFTSFDEIKEFKPELLINAAFNKLKDTDLLQKKAAFLYKRAVLIRAK